MNPYDFGNQLQANTNQFQDQLKQMLLQTGATPQQTEVHTPKVKGRAGAENFNLPPNSDCIALDLDESIAWLIQTDAGGYKTVTPFDISQHKEVKQEDILKTMDERISKLEEALRNGKQYASNNNAKPKSGQQYHDAGSGGNAQG